MGTDSLKLPLPVPFPWSCVYPVSCVVWVLESLPESLPVWDREHTMVGLRLRLISAQSDPIAVINLQKWSDFVTKSVTGPTFLKGSALQYSMSSIYEGLFS